MIVGVQIKNLKSIPDDRGFLMEMLRSDEQIFGTFGQVYVTGVKKGVAKAWHYHKMQDDYFVCVYGNALVVLYDLRKDSKTHGEVNEFKMADPASKGEHILLKIPKGVVHGFTALDCDETRIVNIPTKTYNYDNPDELRYEWDSEEIPYKWPGWVKSGG